MDKTQRFLPSWIPGIICILVGEQSRKSTTSNMLLIPAKLERAERLCLCLWDAENLESGPSAGDILADLKEHVEVWARSSSRGPGAGRGHLGGTTPHLGNDCLPEVGTHRTARRAGVRLDHFVAKGPL